MHNPYYVGVDVGVSAGRNPTAISTLQRRVVPDAEPVLEVIDLARASGVKFEAVATEVERICGALSGEATIMVDATGPGIGVVQVLRRRRIDCVAVTLTGSSPTATSRPGGFWSVPAAMIFETLYRLMVTDRLRIAATHPLTPALLEELDEVTPTETPSGGVRYDGHTAGGGHLDLVVATGLAAVAHERVYAREVMIDLRTARVPVRQPGTGRSTRSTGSPTLDRLRRQRGGSWNSLVTGRDPLIGNFG